MSNASPEIPDDLLAAPSDLVEAGSTGHLAVLFGAGASYESFQRLSQGIRPDLARLRSWPDLLELLCESALRKFPEKSADIDVALDRGKKLDLLTRASVLSRITSEGWLRMEIVRLFSEASAAGASPSALHKALVEIPGAAFITTNYDGLLESAWRAAMRSSLLVLDGNHPDQVRALRAGTLLKLHGDLSRPETIVLTAKDYKRVSHGSPSAWKEKLKSYAQPPNQLLLVGYGYSDPDLQEVLNALQGAYQDQLPGPYWIQGPSLAAEAKASDYGLRPLWIPNHLVPNWLRRLREEIERRQAGDISAPLQARFDLFRGEVERVLDNELRRAAADLSNFRFTEAETRFDNLLTRTRALLAGYEVDNGVLRTKRTHCMLGLGLSRMCLQKQDAAREALLGVAADANTLAPRQIGMLAFSLAQLGEIRQAQELISGVAAQATDLVELQAARQMLDLQQGRELHGAPLDPYLDLLWCKRLIEQGQAAAAVERAMAILTDADEDYINAGLAINVLNIALARTVLSAAELSSPIPVERRAVVVAAVENGLDRLLGLVPTASAQLLPDALKANLLRVALSFYQLTYDQARGSWCREELRQLGQPVPDDLANAQSLAERGQVAEALNALPRQGPTWVQALQQVDIRWLSGLREQALSEVRDLAAAHSQQAPVLLRAADLLLRSNKPKDALTYAERAYSALPCRVNRFILAQCLAGSGSSAEAWRLVAEIPKPPQSIAGHVQELAILRLRLLLAEAEDLPQSPPLVREYLSHNPQDAAAAHLHLARSLHRLSAPQEEVASAAWTAIEHDRQRPILNAQSLYHAARFQRGEGPLGEEARRRVSEIVALSKARFPEDVLAAQHRLELRLAHDLGQDAEDWELLMKAGQIHAVPVEEFLQQREVQGGFNLAAEQAYRMGEISFEALCVLTGADAADYLSQLLRFLRDGTAGPFLCPSVPSGSRRPPPSWKGLRLLTGQLELLLLVHLRLLDRLEEALGPNGQVWVFQDVLDQIESAEQKLLSRAQPDRQAQEEALWRELETLSQAGRIVLHVERERSDVSDEVLAAKEQAAVLQLALPISGAMWLAPQSVLSFLLGEGHLDRGRVDRLRHRLPAGDGPPLPVPLPRRCYVGTDVLREFFSEGALGALAHGLPTQIVVGPETGWLLLSMQAELKKKQEAARLAGDLRRAVGAWRGAKRLWPIKRPAVEALPSALDDETDQAVRRPLHLSFSYGQALEQHREDGRELWLLSADYLREMPLAGGGMQMHLQSLAWPVGLDARRASMEKLLGLSRRAQRQTLTLPDLLREVGADDSVLATASAPSSIPRRELMRLGFTDAATPVEILGLAEEFGTMDRGHPARVLDCIEWRGRERNHPLRQFVGLHLAQVYAGAIWEAFCGRSGLQDLRERVLRGLLQRADALDRDTLMGVLDALLSLLVTQSVTRFQAAFIPDSDGKHMVSNRDTPTSQLYLALGGWVGADGPRRAAYGRAVRNGWLFLDGFIEESGRSGQPEERYVVPLLTAARAMPSHESSEALRTAERESLAIISAIWAWKPLRLDGLQIQAVHQDGTEREISPLLFEDFLAHGVSLLSLPPPLPIESDDGVWSYEMPVQDGQKLPVSVAAEALLLRAPDEVVARLSKELAIDLRPHDGHAYRLLRELAENPGNQTLRRAVARHSVVAPWRLCREDPALYGTLGRRIPGLADVYPEDESQLRALLSEPDGPLPEKKLQLILHQRRQGTWGDGRDAGALLWQAAHVPGLLPAMTLGLRFGVADIDRDDVAPASKDYYEEQVTSALWRLEHPHEQSAAMLAGDLYFLRAAATVRPLVNLAQGQMDLRVLLPERILHVLESVRVQPDAVGSKSNRPEAALPKGSVPTVAGTLASVEAELLRLCRLQVQTLHARSPRGVPREKLIEAAAQDRDLQPREILWLTYRLFQWLVTQLQALSHDARLAGLASLARLAPLPLPKEQCFPDLLDPARFGKGRVEHRLITVLCALSHMESVSLNIALQDEPRIERHLRRVSSRAIEDVLLEFAQRQLSEDERKPVWPVDNPSELDWEGPGNVPELALLALLRTRSEALMRLPATVRLSWLRRLPPAPELEGPLHPLLRTAVVFSAAEHARGLTAEERRRLKDYARAAEVSRPGAEASEVLWPVLAQLYGAGEADLGAEVRARVLEEVNGSGPVTLCGYYLAALSWADPKRLESEVTVLLHAACTPERKVAVARELGRVVFAGNPRVEQRARAVLLQLGRDTPYNEDQEMRNLLSFLGLL